MVEVASLPLTEIRRDPRAQSRARLRPSTIKEYADGMKDGIEYPPITVYRDGEGDYLADGWHRCAAAEKAGLERVDAEIREPIEGETALNSAILCAAGANARHGLPRTNADKRRAVEMLLQDPKWSEFSNRKIADIAKVSERLVRRMRKPYLRLDADAHAPEAVKFERNGKIHRQKLRRSKRPPDSAGTNAEPEGVAAKEVHRDEQINTARYRMPTTLGERIALMYELWESLPQDGVEAYNATIREGPTLSAEEARRCYMWFTDFACAARGHESAEQRRRESMVAARGTTPHSHKSNLSIPLELDRRGVATLHQCSAKNRSHKDERDPGEHAGETSAREVCSSA